MSFVNKAEIRGLWKRSAKNRIDFAKARFTPKSPHPKEMFSMAVNFQEEVLVIKST